MATEPNVTETSTSNNICDIKRASTLFPFVSCVNDDGTIHFDNDDDDDDDGIDANA